MRILCLFLSLMLAAGTAEGSKRNEKSLRFAAGNLDRALERKDTAALNRLLGQDVEYGHSNGWIETRAELKRHLYNGKLVYNSIKLTGPEPRCRIEGGTGLVREEVMIDILLDGKPMQMKLHVLQVWVFRKGTWRLWSRQSTKV